MAELNSKFKDLCCDLPIDISLRLQTGSLCATANSTTIVFDGSGDPSAKTACIEAHTFCKSYFPKAHSKLAGFLDIW